MTRASTETRRQLLHMAAGALALVLRWVTWPQAVLFALTALVFNVILLPRLASSLLRPGDRERILRSGIALYPATVLLLIFILPARLDIVATAWVILAIGDGLATLVGVHVRTAALPWNRHKSIGGLAAFIAGASIAAWAMERWMAPSIAPAPNHWFVTFAPVAAAIIAGFVETTPIALDDNITVTTSAALVMWSLSACDAASWVSSSPAIGIDIDARVVAAIVVNVVFALAGWKARTVTGVGAIAGAIIGIVVWLAAGGAGWTMLLMTFLFAAAATKAGHRRKARLGIAEEHGGRRGPGNAIANTAVGAWAAVVALGMANPLLAHIAMVAALATAASDTVASEIGKALGRTTWLVTTFRRVPAGTSGAISLEGLVANIVAAFALAAIGAALGLMPVAAVRIVTIAAVIASLLEGGLGATLEAKGLLDNDAVNFLNTLMGAGLAMLLWVMR